jgi:uncharacterized protein YceK
MTGWKKLLISTRLVLMASTSGCATLTTMSHVTRESPLVYSGTRLDIHASAGNENTLRIYREKYGVEPPEYSKLDLPFSFLLDTIILIPIVMPTALYRAVFE